MPAKNRIIVERSFRQLPKLIDECGLHLKAEEVPVSHPPFRRDFASDPEEVVESATDEELFMDAMQDVARVSWRNAPHSSPPPMPMATADSEADERGLMQSAMSDDTPLPVLDHPEYIEGWIGLVGRKFLPRLRNGLYSIQGQIDLHGFNRVQARAAVENYIVRMSRFQSCCIKIIHGRGINSPTDKATLKEDLQRLLKTRRMSRCVVAFASAPQCDGGVGAVYVLLRRR